MAIKIVHSSVRNLEEPDYQACAALGFDLDEGNIRKDIQRIRNLHYRTPACVVMAKDKATNEVLSWALVEFWGPAQEPYVQCYTKPEHRRKGLGSKIIAEIKRVMGTDKISHSPHDEASTNFFQKVGLKCPSKPQESTSGDWSGPEAGPLHS